MESKNDFVAYEYKKIMVKRDSVSVFTDCLSNFGWILIDEYEYGYQPEVTSYTPVHTVERHTNDLETVVLKFKRDRHIRNKLEVSKLERKCETALSSAGSLERKNNAYKMGITLGVGILGAVFLAIAVFNFISANVIIGVFLTILGIAGLGIGYLANRKVEQKRSEQTEPMIQQQLEIAYEACEQAHALLAQ